MCAILAAFPGRYDPVQLLEMPCAQVAHLFWMGFIWAEERLRRELEAHAHTAWWVHNSIEFAQGVEHTSWDDWVQMRGLRWRSKPRKTRAQLVDEINAKFDQAFHADLRFAPAPPMTMGV